MLKKNDTYHEKEYKRQVETNINIKIRSLIALFIISFSLITCGISENGEADSHSILHRGYYQNRQLKEMGAIIDSIKQGYWVTYDSLGNIKSESVYIDGEINGPFNLYYPNGEMKVKGNILSGNWVGERTFYYSNGNIMNNGYYRNGELDSIWVYYDETGKIDKRIQYKNGEKIEVLENNKITPPFP